MKNRLGKIEEKPYGGGGGIHSPALYVQGLSSGHAKAGTGKSAGK